MYKQVAYACDTYKDIACANKVHDRILCKNRPPMILCLATVKRWPTPIFKNSGQRSAGFCKPPESG